jgi:hypothetical protein
MEAPIEAHHDRAVREIAKMLAQFKRLHPIGSQVWYSRGFGQVLATVVGVPDDPHGLYEPRIFVEGQSGKRYWLYMSRVESAAK